ncbi:hypothetical protein [Alkalisalibacterium limincola]|uniref:hypothetical protein n=1 Tax=Alkalisalibacterium limincola TaxID=2699169 RepID=UPI0021084D04|nr:hypothetical protein [Alkalisalibacterium limincola]
MNKSNASPDVLGPVGVPASRSQRLEHLPDTLGRAILDVVGDVPSSRQVTGGDREAHAQAIIDAASRRAGLVAGSLALPPGPLGWMTVLPEMVAIWKIQTQMVADVSAIHGQHWRLGKEQMLFCLFRHTGAQVFRDFAVRAGQRWLVQAATQMAMRDAARRIGMNLSTRAIGRGVARWVPIVGAVGVGTYAWYDTRQVGQTALTLFSQADPPLQPA